jgi:hypothetical protein
MVIPEQARKIILESWRLPGHLRVTSRLQTLVIRPMRFVQPPADPIPGSSVSSPRSMAASSAWSPFGPRAPKGCRCHKFESHPVDIGGHAVERLFTCRFASSLGRAFAAV